MFDLSVSIFTCILILCMFGIYITFVVLLIKFLLGIIKYFRLKNALLLKELYKPTEVQHFDYDASQRDIENNFKTV